VGWVGRRVPRVGRARGRGGGGGDAGCRGGEGTGNLRV
jgi:hypothetical protein